MTCIKWISEGCNLRSPCWKTFRFSKNISRLTTRRIRPASFVSSERIPVFSILNQICQAAEGLLPLIAALPDAMRVQCSDWPYTAALLTNADQMSNFY